MNSTDDILQKLEERVKNLEAVVYRETTHQAVWQQNSTHIEQPSYGLTCLVCGEVLDRAWEPGIGNIVRLPGCKPWLKHIKERE